MPKKKKETTGLLVAVAPVTMEEKEKKAGGGLLESDRQQYQEGSEVEVVGIPQEERESFTLEDGRAIDSEGREASLHDLASGRFDVGRFLERSFNTPTRLSEDLQEALIHAEKLGQIYGTKPRLFIPFKKENNQLEKYSYSSEDELIEEMKTGRVRHVTYPMLKR